MRRPRTDQRAECIERLAGCGLQFGFELRDLWHEYEAQQTLESRWVKVLDRLMPFVVNLATEGRAWRDQNVARSQVLAMNEPIRRYAPEIFAWMQGRIDECVGKGWLREG